MKKLILLISLLTIALIGCNGFNEEDIDLTELGYYEYLDDGNPKVIIKVKKCGTMVLQLFPDVAENTVNNFIQYIEEGAYSDSSFHRIIEDFMIQGGIVSDTNCSIKGEFASNGVYNNLSHYRGVLSMARANLKNSANSQFFIVHEDSDFLDNNYAGFGGLISGFNVLDQLAKLATNDGDAPLKNVVIESISIELNDYVAREPVCAFE